MSTTIHIHEDDWGMRALYPLAARVEAEAGFQEARRASEANRAPDGLGWTHLHVIEPPDVTFSDVGLTAARAAEILHTHLPKVTRFVATAMAGFEPDTHDPLGVYDDDPVCFGRDAEAFVKADLADGRLAAIWFELRTEDRAKAEELRRALTALDSETPCMIVDYWLDRTGAVSDEGFLNAYFAALTKPEDNLNLATWLRARLGRATRR